MGYDEQLDDLAEAQGFTEIFVEVERKNIEFKERDLFAWKIVLGIEDK